MIRKALYTLCLVSALLLTGCAVHQWPDPKVLPEKVTLRLRFEPDMWLWEHLYDPKTGNVTQLYPGSGVDEEHPGTSARYSNELDDGVMSISVRISEAGNTGNCIAEYFVDRKLDGSYDCDVDVELFEGNYEVIVWSHLLEREGAQPFYDAGDLRTIYLVDENYRGSTDYRDAFRGRTSFAVFGGEECVCEVEMLRPMGKFEFVTTDLSEFLDRETERRNLSTRARAEDYRVVIAYPYYFPNGYSAFSDDISSGSGYGFNTRMTVTGVSEASMGFDYVFMRNAMTDGAVQAQVSVYDTEGNRVANSQVIKVPMRRDYHTVLRGAFLSIGAQGGVGVNPDYDGDYNVTFP